MNRVSGVLLAGLVGAALAGGAHGQDAPKSRDLSKEEQQLVGSLKKRVKAWIAARQMLVEDCAPCDGDGEIPREEDHRLVIDTCPHCTGAGNRVAPEQAEKLFWKYRSPRWRALEGSREAADKERKEFTVKDAWALQKSFAFFVAGEPIDATHAIAHLTDNRAPKQERWVLETEGKKTEWYLWMPGAGDDWPDKAAREDVSPAAANSAPAEAEVIDSAQRGVLNEALAKTSTRSKVTGLGRTGRTLVVTLELEKPADEDASLQAVQADSVVCVRALLSLPGFAWDAARLDFTVTHKNRFGGLEPKPVWTVAMDAETFAQITWENLEAAERWELFTSEQPTHDGWTRFAGPVEGAAVTDPPAPGAEAKLPSWAELLSARPDAAVVSDESLRSSLEDTGLAWQVRDRASGIEMLLVPDSPKPFYCGRYEVQQTEWEHLLHDAPPSDEPGLPVSSIDLGEIKAFLERSPGLRLLTDSEWTAACNAGADLEAGIPIAERAWCPTNAEGECHVVGQKSANALGLHDLLGNLGELCLTPTEDGDVLTFRGGTYNAKGRDEDCSCSWRGRTPTPEDKGVLRGFRVARDV